MKVLIINSHYNQSGAGKIVTCISRELIKRGHQTKVLYGRGVESADEEAVKVTSNIENYVDALATRIFGLNGYTCKYATYKLIQEIEDFEPDVINLHALHGYYVNFQMLFSYLVKRQYPIVWTFHDCLAFTGNCGYYCECDKWKEQCYKCVEKKTYPSSLFFDFSKKMFIDKKNSFLGIKNMIVVSPSRWMTENAIDSFFGKYRCITINNGIDAKNLFVLKDKKKSRAELGLDINDSIVLGVAHDFNDKRKGAKYLLEFAKYVEEDNITLVLIGWNDRDNKYIKDCKNIKTVTYISNQDELATYYAAADVFLLPSLEENYATVALEAISCGTPVVGFAVGGTPEIAKEGRGTTVEKGNVEQLVKNVRKILSGESEISTGKDLRKHILENNSVESMVDEYMKAYTDVIKMKNCYTEK